MNNLGGYKRINDFVRAKLDRYENMDRSFASLFGMMFSERDNVMYERSVGYRIEKTTYGESRDRILRKARTLRDRLPALSRDDVVALCMDNSLEWIEAFWAILCAGFRVVLFNLRLDPAVLRRTITDLNVRAVVSDGMEFPVTTIPSEDLVPADTLLEDSTFGTELMVMSSGTSGSAKVCSYTAEEFLWLVKDSFDIVRSCRQIKKHYEGELKLLTFLPFYHIFGLVAVYIWFGFFSRTFVHLGDMSPSTILNTIRRHKVTHIFAVPLFWNKVYEQAVAGIRDRGDRTWKKFEKGLSLAHKLEGLPLLHDVFCRAAFREVRDNLFGGSIRFMITGGSEVRGEVMAFFNSIGYRLANGYGMTEIGITSVELSDKPRTLISGSIGRPLPSVEYRLNGEGELQVRGKAACRTITEQGVRRDREEWYDTHDLAECRKGRWYILGRRDDVVISPSGENLNPNLIEPTVRCLPGVTEACLCGIRGGDGVKPTLIVSADRRLLMREGGCEELRADVAKALNDMSLGTQIASVVVTADPLIRASDIKLNRRAVAKRYAEGGIRAAETAGPSGTDRDDAVMTRIRAIFAEALNRPVEEITDGYDFFLDGGGTSLDYLAVLPEFEKAFSVAVPVSSDGKSLSRVTDFYDFIKDALNA